LITGFKCRIFKKQFRKFEFRKLKKSEIDKIEKILEIVSA